MVSSCKVGLKNIKNWELWVDLKGNAKSSKKKEKFEPHIKVGSGGVTRTIFKCFKSRVFDSTFDKERRRKVLTSFAFCPYQQFFILSKS